jgi:hypothetical protein
VFLFVAILIIVLIVVIVLIRTCGNEPLDGVDVIEQPTDPASFEINDLTITSAEVEPGETVTVEILVTNTGDLSGNCEISFTINGEIEGTREIILDGGSRTKLTFTTSRDTEGTYNFTVDGQTGQFSVIAPVEEVSPIASWSFDEGSGDMTYDTVGSNHGTLMGDTYWVSGPSGYGSALAFDGDGDWVEIANEMNFDLDIDDAFTIEAWVQTDSDQTMDILSKMPILKPATGYQLLKHGTEVESTEAGGGNRIYLFLINVYDSDDGFRNTDAVVVYGSTDIADGRWHHIKVTYDGSATAEGIQIYVDGKPEIMHTRNYGENKGLWDTVSGSMLNDLPLQISGREGDKVAWDGFIDEVKIWDLVT